MVLVQFAIEATGSTMDVNTHGAMFSTGF